MEYISDILISQHQQCLALFNRIKFTRLLLTALITFTKKEVKHIEAVRSSCRFSVLDAFIHWM